MSILLAWHKMGDDLLLLLLKCIPRGVMLYLCLASGGTTAGNAPGKEHVLGRPSVTLVVGDTGRGHCTLHASSSNVHIATYNQLTYLEH